MTQPESHDDNPVSVVTSMLARRDSGKADDADLMDDGRLLVTADPCQTDPVTPFLASLRAEIGEQTASERTSDDRCDVKYTQVFEGALALRARCIVVGTHEFGPLFFEGAASLKQKGRNSVPAVTPLSGVREPPI